jgi:hypothetical protein
MPEIGHGARDPVVTVGLSAGLSGCGFRWSDIRSGQQLWVHRPCDVGQDARPIHDGLFAPIADPLWWRSPQKLYRNASGTAMLAVDN